jgi:tripartite-type tricarboxylate transporter receptor subunit TctC
MMRVIAVILGAYTVAVSAACAQPYPTRPIRLIVPFTPGGGADIVARVFSAELSKRLGQTIIVDNRAGANGKIGARALIEAPNDGYTVLLGTISTHASDPDLYRSPPPYDPLKDFVPVTLISDMPMVLVVNPQVPAKSLSEFVALAKKEPGKLNFASAGVGNIGHLTMELFMHQAGIKMVNVPFRGASNGAQAVLAHTVDAFFDVYPSELPHIKSGGVRGLALSAKQRNSLTPDLPTTAEGGYPGVLSSAWTGLFVPPGTPDSVVKRLSDAANEVLAMPSIHKSYEEKGMTAPEPNSPQQFHEFLKQELVKWSTLEKQIGLIN